MTALRKVLVVDDDPVVGRSFDRVLANKGYAVITAKDGEEALTKLATENYDVVYTDIRMPGMSGLEVAEKVKAKQPWTPVVIITGYGTSEDEARAKATGVTGFLHKPLSPEMIEDSAREAIEATGVVEEVEIPTPAAAPAGAGTALKNIALFFLAPFIALAYIVVFPFVGLAMLAWLGVKAVATARVGRAVGRIVKTIGLLLTAPFIGLAYVVIFPFVALAMLLWMGGKALMHRTSAD